MRETATSVLAIVVTVGISLLLSPIFSYYHGGIALPARKVFATAGTGSGDTEVIFYAFLQSIIAVTGIVAGMGVTLYLYWRDQKAKRMEVIARSCQTILWELEDNRKTLTEADHEKISYSVNSGADRNRENAKQVLYTNAYLYDEAYRTLINSGSFSYFKSNTQYKLVSLYGRIRSRNELLTYVDQLQDQIMGSELLKGRNNGDAPSVAETNEENALFKLRERYDLTLTKWESEISGLIPNAKELIESEIPNRRS